MPTADIIYIYPDVAFLMSLVMNFIILCGTAKFLGKSVSCKRMGLVALLGAIYSFGASFPDYGILHSIPIKIIFSLVMTALAVFPSTLPAFLIFTVAFYVVSFLMGGVMIGFIFFIQNGPFYSYLYDFPCIVSTYILPTMVLLLPALFIMYKISLWIVKRRTNRQDTLVPIRVWLDKASVQVNALVDTGNTLEDPFSNKPVVIVEYSALKSLFNREMCLALECNGGNDPFFAIESISKSPWADRFRLIPFSAMGKENGLLLGFRPDLLEVNQKSHNFRTSDVVICLYQKTLNLEGVYKALLHPGLVNLESA